MSQPPWVLLITNPYEGELCRRTLGETGLRIIASDGGEGALSCLDGEAPLLIVLALGLVHADALELLTLIRDRLPAVPVFLLADRDGQVPDEEEAVRLGAQRLFLRPIDGAALASAIDKAAVEAELSIEVGEELSQLTGGVELTPAPGPLPVSPPTDALSESHEVPISLEGTEIVSNVAVGASARFMRADDALLDPVGSMPFSLVPRSESVERSQNNLPRMTILTTAETLPETGSLDRVDIAELLGTLYAAAFTGRLLLHRGDGERQLFFEGGAPVFATSTFGKERLADLLWREGKLTREQYTRASELGAESGRRAASQLVEKALIKPSEIFPLLRRQLEEVLYASFALTEGDYQLGPEQVAADDRLRLSVHPFYLYLEGIRRKYGLDRLIELVGPLDTVLSPTSLMPRFVAEAQLSPSERMAAAQFDGERTLADVRMAISGSPSGALGEAGLYALAWALGIMGAALFDAEGAPPDRATTDGTSVMSKPGERRGSDRLVFDRPSDRAIDRAIDRDRVLAKHSQILDGDYFTILGVERQASVYEIRRAFERLHIDFSPERFADPVRSELGEALAEIQEVLGEACQVLLDDEIREQYRLHLPK